MYQVGKSLTNPVFVLLLILGLVMVSAWWRRRETRRWLLMLTIPFLLLVALSLPVLGQRALDTLESQNPRLAERPDDVQAIVVIGGGQAASFFRCRLAARLYHMGKSCPVLYSSSPGEVPYMRGHLLEMGVQKADLVEDADARNTHENAVNSHDLLEPKKISKIILVTDAAHMPRAAATFRKAGFEVVPASVFSDPIAPEYPLLDYIPNAGALGQCQYASQEWLGMGWYWCKNRI